MKEYWDIYDSSRNKTTRTIERGTPFKEGEYYVCCEIWILNSKGEILITKRHPSKKAGGMWEFTGGGVLAGETTGDAAVREVKEELGIDISRTDIELLSVYQHRNYFMDIYKAQIDINLNDLKLQENEVTDAKWVDKDTLQQMIAENKVVRSVSIRYNMFKDEL